MDRLIKNNKPFKVLMLLILSLSACSLDNYDVCSREWKYGNGFYIGDFPLFGKNGYRISNDTIFLSDTSKALIISTNRGFIINTSRIEIKSLKTGMIGTYYELGKRKE